MNNRKPKNKRGKITRRKFVQEAPEAKTITRKGEKIPNPAYPGTRRLIHQQVPKGGDNLWGAKTT